MWNPFKKTKVIGEDTFTKAEIKVHILADIKMYEERQKYYLSKMKEIEEQKPDKYWETSSYQAWERDMQQTRGSINALNCTLDFFNLE